MSDLGASNTYTPFQPPGDASSESTYFAGAISGIPRYLFRVYDWSSSGFTSRSEVCSPAFGTLPKDLFRQPREDAAAMLNAHLRWKCCGRESHKLLGGRECNLMSWTSSLLFALQYALYRHKTQDAKPQLSEIKILMVDTRDLCDRNVFTRDLQTIRAFKQYPPSDQDGLGEVDDWRSSGSYYFGEYLSQGRLVLKPEQCCEVTMKDLVDRGLFKICAGLGDSEHWHRLATRVNGLRRRARPKTALSEDALQVVIDVAEAFEGFEVPAALRLLGLSPFHAREGGGRMAHDAIEGLPKTDGSRGVVCDSSSSLGGHHDHLPELQHCQYWYDVFAGLSAPKVEDEDGDLIDELARLVL
ncbi:uncharacterized protein B0I36DRAFT_319420 [Microdochium trichocladiopsis]|uniref:DUF7587 domain-containing protein n=1 Tax=Microdochium trichocladiopsis TaxID=1682393 RepID=A0A9P8YDK2_9PEZI|nr:uncharacterized protein B0I36DRAFT_319420 [Microdochium trichocladiopsis]KAH7035945.1 hypothetical protein B0I36DRAFT_319420 [Microdochium trichocladiopsis]